MNPRFLSYLEEVYNNIVKDIENNNRFLILSSNNPDSLSAATQLLNFFYEYNIDTHLTFIDNLNIKEVFFGEDSYEYESIIILDTGSLYIDELRKANKELKRRFYVFDHHFLINKDINLENVIQINPMIFNMDGYNEISTSSIIYLLLKNASIERDISYLSLIGPLSELQENSDLYGSNKEILEELKNNGKINYMKGPKLTSIYTKPLYKVLSASFDVFLPNITGSEEKSLEFLKKINIKNKRGLLDLYYKDLEESEIKNLISDIISIRIKSNIGNAENVIGNVYEILEEKNFKDLRELVYIFYGIIYEGETKNLLYFLGKEDLNEDLKKLYDKYIRTLSSVFYNILENKFEINEDNNILIIKIKSSLNNGYIISHIASLLHSQGLINKKVFVILYDISDNLYRGVLRISTKNNKKDANSIIKYLYEKNVIMPSTFDNFGGFIMEKSKYEEFIKNLKIALKQFEIII